MVSSCMKGLALGGVPSAGGHQIRHCQIPDVSPKNFVRLVKHVPQFTMWSRGHGGGVSQALRLRCQEGFPDSTWRHYQQYEGIFGGLSERRPPPVS
jgi:hypothetical protein